MADGSPEEVLTKIFRVFDVNSDGTISKNELKRLVKDMYGLINVDNTEQVRGIVWTTVVKRRGWNLANVLMFVC